MRDVFKIIIFEFKKILYNTKWLVLSIIAFILLSISLVIIKNLISLPNYEVTPDEIRIEENIRLRDNYKTLYEISIGLKDGENMILPPDVKENSDFYYSEYTRYQYYLDHNSSQHDYIDVLNPSGSTVGMEKGVFKIYLGNEIGLIIIFAFSIIVTIRFVLNDYSSGYIKNINQSKISMKKIFLGKLIILALSIIMFSIFLFIITCTVISIGDKTTILIDSNKGLVEVTTSKYLIDKLALHTLISFTLSTMIILVSNKIKNTYTGVFSGIVIVLVFYGSFISISPMLSSFQASKMERFIPFLSSISSNFMSLDIFYYVIIVIYLTLSCLISIKTATIIKTM